MRTAVVSFTLVLALPLGILVFGGADAAPAAKTKCEIAEQRQFDFWIGDWTVTDTAGVVQGTNNVEAVLGGCAVQEHWVGADGSAGTSLNAYIKFPKKWHQSWIADAGNMLQLDGGLVGGKMVLEGPRPDGKGGTVRDRITWTPMDANRVRQTWVASGDNGRSWSVVFDGIYARKRK